MKFNDFRKGIINYPLFNRKDLEIIFPDLRFITLNKQLSLWVKKGQIIRLRNGVYLLAPEFLSGEIQPSFLAAKIYTPSYISLEYALSAYGIIPEATFEITSVTSKATRKFITQFGTYSYRAVKTDCFFGFKTKKAGKFVYYFAEPEKALLDYLYLNMSQLAADCSFWKTRRFSNLESLNFKRLKNYTRRFESKKLLSLVLNLIAYAKSN